MALTLTAKELQLGDIVRLSDGPYSTATVNKIDEEMVWFFRPYVHTAGFTTGCKVITYIGIEEFPVYRDSTRTYEVIERNRKLWEEEA